jgi:iron complex outermembrane receptor protein
MSRIGLKPFYCGAVVTLIAPTALNAQELPADRAAQLEEVVVTATRTETDLQQTPIAVTALSGQALSERNVTTLLDVTNYVPSLSIGSRSGTSTESGGVSIRGMGVDAMGSSAAVGIYVDDVYFASGPGDLLGLLDADRVEVLRGPQGTLFGRNTIAGAIQYVTHQPDDQFGGFLTTGGGNDSRGYVQGALNVPVTDTFALRLAGGVDTRGGYIRDLNTGTLRGADRTQEARLKARWTPSDRLTVDFKAEMLNESTNGRAVLVGAVNPNSEFVGLAQLFGETSPLNNSYLSTNDHSFPGFNAPDYLHFNYYETQGVINYRLTDDIDVKSISSYSWYRVRNAQDLDNTPLSIISLIPPHDDTDVFTQELQMVGSALSKHLRWTAGAYFYDSAEETNPGQGVALGFAPPSYTFGNPETDIVSKSLYGQVTYYLTSRLSVTGGLRYSRETTTGWLIGLTAPTSATFPSTSPYVGFNFQLADDVMLYVKASKGFRAGGLNVSAALPGGGVAYAPETAWTYEAGARMEFLDHKLRINPTVFWTDWSNIQFNSLIPTATTVVAGAQNAGDARIKGFELENQFAVTQRVALTGSLSLLDGYYTRVGNLTRSEYPFGFLASLPNPVTGQVLPGSTVTLPNLTLDTPLQRAPKEKVAVGVRYNHPLFADSQLVANLDYVYTAKQYSAVTISDAVEMPAYGVLNGRLQYDGAGDRWSVAAFGTNLTNKFYLLGGVDFAAGYTTGTRELDPARPREYGLEAKVRF